MKFLRPYFPAATLCLAGLVLMGAYFLRPPSPPINPTPQSSMWILDGAQASLVIGARIPANLLANLGIHLFPGDQVLVDGETISANDGLSSGAGQLIQVIPARLITLIDQGRKIQFSCSAATVGEGLWQAGIQLDPADRIEPNLETLLTGDTQVEIQRAVPLTITVGEQSLSGRTAAKTVGDALAEFGLALQGLDYAIPEESAPVPAHGSIRLVRVNEQVSLEQKTIPFKSQYQADPETELDQQSVIQPGETGLIVSRVRARLEDGKEVSRTKEAEWTARLPKDQLVGYGTNPVIHTETVDGVALEYWRKVTAYATSYAPCEIYADHCSYTTASGMTLTKGVAAVIRSWYYQMRGQQVYIPGYGTAVIADIGAGVPGQNWIDLGYSDSDYVEWHQPVTIYFLTPIPANIPINLP